MKNIFLLFFALFLIGCGQKQPWNPQEIQQSDTPSEDNNIQQTQTPAISFNTVKPLFEKHCISCHQAIPPDWRDEKKAIEYAKNGELYNRIWLLKDGPRGMPLNNSTDMTDKERQEIVKWIEAQSTQLDNNS